MAIAVDSNIVIDALNQVPQGRAELLSDADCHVSIMTFIEVLAGCPDPDAERDARDLLRTLRVIPVSSDIAEETIRIRRTTRLKLPDAIILASARVHGLRLSTRNTRDFSRDDPAVRIPYEL